MDIFSSYIVCIVGVVLLLGIIKLFEVLFPSKTEEPKKKVPLSKEDLIRIRKECEEMDREIEEENRRLSFDYSTKFDSISDLTNTWKDKMGCEYSADKRTLIKGCNIESYTIREGTISIGVGAFSHCNTLFSVTFPQSLREIGEGAFWGCTRLEHVFFYWRDSNLFKIGKTAFDRCTSLQKIIIPEKSTEKFDLIFSDAGYNFKKGFVEIYFDDCLDWDYCGEPIHISDFRALHGEERVVEYYGRSFNHRFCFEDGTTALFSRNLEESVGIDKSCLYIRQCRGVGLDEIGYVAYNDRGVMGDTVFADDTAYLYLDEGTYTRDGLTLLKGNYSFYSFEVFRGTKNIANKAFCDFYEYGIQCYEDECLIEDIIIPSSVDNIGSAPFGSNLKTVVCNSPHFKIEKKPLYTSDFKRLIQCFNKTDEGVFVVPDSVEEIGELAFYCCRFKKIVIGKSVKVIGRNPFVSEFIDNMSGCEVICDSDNFLFKDSSLLDANNNLISYLGEVNYGKENSYIVPDGVRGIGDYAFRYYILNTLTLPSSLLTISDKAFENLKVKKIIVPKGCKESYISLLPTYASIIIENNI